MLKKDQTYESSSYSLQPSSTFKIKEYNRLSTDNNIRTKSLNSRIVRQTSTPKLRNNNDNNKPMRRYHSIHSVSRLSIQSMNSNPRDSSSDIRMIYDYYQSNRPNLVKDEKFSSNVDKYGFVTSEGKKFKVVPTQEKKHDKKDAKRSLKWAHWVSNSKLVVRSGNFGISSYKFPWDSKFFKRISKGVPDSWRSPVWYYLATNGSTDTEYDEDLVKTYKVRNIFF
jgi:hypothetical protein